MESSNSAQSAQHTRPRPHRQPVQTHRPTIARPLRDKDILSPQTPARLQKKVFDSLRARNRSARFGALERDRTSGERWDF
jgi:hypothetical protein